MLNFKYSMRHAGKDVQLAIENTCLGFKRCQKQCADLVLFGIYSYKWSHENGWEDEIAMESIVFKIGNKTEEEKSKEEENQDKHPQQ